MIERDKPAETPEWIAEIAERFKLAWQQAASSPDVPPRVTDFLGNETGTQRKALLRELVRIDRDYRVQNRLPWSLETYLGEHPELRGPEAILPNEVPAVCLDSFATESPEFKSPIEAPPKQIGRYSLDRVLGEGGFGRVYLARDGQLQRLVAIKVPHRELLTRPEEAEAYLREARTVADLDHPNIVPVYDVGTTSEYPCFVVSKYIDGSDLAASLKQSRPSLRQVVELVATVAETLHYAHKRGLVHRDIKPGNILLDKTGKPFVTDFGLALREQDVGHGPHYAGTPAYMSPEQARGEGHRVDGRSDIFSLGVVLYELVAGRRPFRADSLEELRVQISQVEAKPPRQIDDAVPKELDRICLKALSKRASERYSTARDLAEDLRHFLVLASVEEKSAVTGRPRENGLAGAAFAEAEVPTPTPTPLPTPSTEHPVRIVPKGLRSFDASDADFFLELLAGPRDREGLPDTVRFWKSRIEETNADGTFSVGLIYGPSGCGKSSLVKAALLPRLARSVAAVYVEASPEETEQRVLKGLRRQLPELPEHFGLVESLAALRRGRFLKSGQKVLLVLDQFEQWLHAKQRDDDKALVQALRHCDGGRLQCVVMVRDDFWLAISRFMQALEIPVVEGENSRLVDLFDLRHARKVLTAFGRAFGALPDQEVTKDQDTFLNQAVAGLAQDGKVISVRLALFAEMVKGKPWTPRTLKDVGGMEGVGLTFFEETFAASTAPPRHRVHQKAAQGVLKALLPDAGAALKGNMRPQQELLEASGYVNRPKDFAELLHILDGELRLITPTDPEGNAEGEATAAKPRSSEGRYYQLTHDYLVPALRDWLTRKEKETRRGRAELLLVDRAALWNARQENRQLPSFLQWFQILWWTRKKNWTPSQRTMMRRATRYHGIVLITVMAGLAAGLVFLGFKQAEVLAERNAAVAARDQAAKERKKAEAINKFYEDHVLTAGRPKGWEGGAGRDVTLKQTLDQASAKVDEAFAGQPELEATVRNTLGMTYWYLGEYEASYPHLKKAYAIRSSVLGPEAADTLTSLHNLAMAYWKQGKFAEALSMGRQALKGRQQVLGPDHPDTLWSQLWLGLLLFNDNQLDESELTLRQAIDSCRRTLGADHRYTLHGVHDLAIVLCRKGKFEEGVAAFRDALAGRRRALGADHPETLRTMGSLAWRLGLLAQDEEAEVLGRQALEGRRRVLGAEHTETLWSEQGLGEVLTARGKYPEAEVLLRHCLTAQRKALGLEHRDVADSLDTLGDLLTRSGRPAEAEPLLRECLTIREKQLPTNHWWVARARSLYGASLAKQGKFDRAEPLLLDSYTDLAKAVATPPRQLARALDRLIELYDQWSKPEKAEKWRKKMPNSSK